MDWSNKRPCAERRTTFWLRRAFGPNRFHRGEDRLALEHHAFRAAERPVVHRAMAIVRPVAQIVYLNVQQARVFAALHYAMRKRSLEEFGEDRKHMEITGGLSPSVLRAILPRSVWPRDRSPHRWIVRTESAADSSTTSTGAAAFVPGGHMPHRFARALVHHLAADQVGLEVFALVQRGALAGWNAHFPPVQKLGIGDGIHSAELEYQRPAVKPSRFDFVFPRPADPSEANRKTSCRA